MSIYLPGGGTASLHVHRLRRIKDKYDPKLRYQCVECGTQLERLSGILLPTKPHDKIQCVHIDSGYGGSTARQHSGYWVDKYECPNCKRTGKFLSNYLGKRTVFCDGLKFSKEVIK